MERRRRIDRLILLLAGLITALLVAEVAVRVARPTDTGSSHQYRLPHPVLGWVLQPDVTYRNRMSDGTTFVTYNSRGWRDVEHDREKPPGRFRVVVLGDSFMEAYSVGFDESFHRRLERRLRGGWLDAETVNLGVGGYGTLQQYLAYREEGRRYAPDLVLLGLYTDNDVRNNSFELESRIETRGLKADSRPFLQPGPAGDWTIRQADYEGARRRHEAIRADRDGRLHSVREHSALVALLLSRIETWKSKRPGSRPSVGRDPVDPELALNGVHLCDEPPEIGAAWELTGRILKRLKREVEADGSRLVVFTVPSWQLVDSEQIRRAEAETTTHGRLCLDEPAAHRRLAEVLARLDIELVNLLPAFRSAAADGREELFHRGDRHWNRRGHDLAAQLVYQQLFHLKLLPLRDPPPPRDLLSPADARKGVPAGSTTP